MRARQLMRIFQHLANLPLQCMVRVGRWKVVSGERLEPPPATKSEKKSDRLWRIIDHMRAFLPCENHRYLAVSVSLTELLQKSSETFQRPIAMMLNSSCNHHIRLPRARPEYGPKSIQIIPTRARVHHFYGATSKTKSHPV